mmetsp:Transcript_25038/g.68035  ORF Transcript_25038/g.68035 Transcript_25038/m.68035 type:complete len:224 (-) Transcript_25038:1634-2305(-)
MRCPHHSWRLMHQSRMFSSHRNHTTSNSLGMISSSPLRTAAQDLAAIVSHLTHHWGFKQGSITSLLRLQMPKRMGLSVVPRKRPNLSRASTTVTRALKRGWPANSPPCSLMYPSSSNTLMDSRLWRLPVLKSLGSWAGVIFTAPVPKFMSTSSASQMMGMRRWLSGCTANLPCRCLYLGSSGWTATAVSPSMVSGRVVATTISPPPSRGYAKLVSTPNSTGSV